MKTASTWSWALCLAIVTLATLAASSGGQADEAAKGEEIKVDEASIAKPEETLQHVPTITKIEYAIEKTNPPNLIITAYGQTPTGGWSKIQLLRRIYITPPADGIWEYDLIGIAPEIGPTVLTPVKASNTWKAYDVKIFKGVRVYGIGRGAKEIKIP